MLKNILSLFLCVSSLTGFGQSVAGLNFKHQYDPKNEVDLSMKLVNDKHQLTVYYRLRRNGQLTEDNYNISWLRYESYTQKEGTPLTTADSLGTTGKISFPVPDQPWLLVANVSPKSGGPSWKYLQVMDGKYPVNGYLEGSDGVVFKPYVFTEQEYTIMATRNDQPIHVYYYKTEFPPALPPFADKGATMDRFMFADSSFHIASGQKIQLRSKGLYLAQQDTTASEGFAFLAVNGAYPKLNKIEDIPDPLVFVCAKEEHDSLIAAGNDKAKVDKVILDITRDKERAKAFMRNFFRNVEFANTYFTSYKQGWKTDRGMIFLIFGLPDEISRTGSNETWYYKRFNERFTFVKVGSIYDPTNFVLQRSSKYSELWFNTVDLWRKSRF